MKIFSRFWLWFAGIALATVLVACLALYVTNAFLRYQKMDDFSRRNGGWAAAQAEMHYQRLLSGLDRYRLGDSEMGSDQLRERFEIFWSRLPVLLEGPESDALRQSGVAVDSAQAVLTELQAIEPIFMSLQPNDEQGYRDLRDRLAAFEPQLNEILRQALRAAPDAVTVQRDDFAKLLYLLLFLGLFFGSLLVMLLLREMRLSERRAFMLEAVLENMEQGLVAFDSDRRLIMANRHFGELAMLPPDMTKRGTLIDELVRHNALRGEYGDGTPEHHVQAFREYFLNPVPHRMLRGRPDGRIIEMRSNPMPHGGVVATYTDVTQAKQTEHELLAAKDAAETANHAKTSFLANMSHELRTPLNAILGFAEMMAQEMLGPLSPRYREYSQLIGQSGHHLLALIEDILDLSKIEAGRLTPDREEVDLVATVEFALVTLASHINRNRLQIVRRFGGAFPRLAGDRRMCRQIFLNLLSNAVKFTPEGGQIEIMFDIGHDGSLIFSVSDTGIGIAQDHLNRVLEPFYQVESTFSRRHRGTGLGLPLTKKLVELHEGRISLESELGRSTTVTITFPKSRLLPAAGAIARRSESMPLVSGLPERSNLREPLRAGSQVNS